MACGNQGDNQAVVRGHGPIVSSRAVGNGWNFDELMAAASRAAKVVVSGEREIFSPAARKTPHVTVGAGFNYRGDAPPLLIILAGPRCSLAELATLQASRLGFSCSQSIRMGEATGVSSVVHLVR
jgi:hypothetical protein